MKTYLVHIKDDLTAYDTWRGDDPGRENEPMETTETLHTYKFPSFDEAHKFYLHRKNMLRFAGTAGMYVTYPTEQD